MVDAIAVAQMAETTTTPIKEAEGG